jgi:hypothetical protein
MRMRFKEEFKRWQPLPVVSSESCETSGVRGPQRRSSDEHSKTHNVKTVLKPPQTLRDAERCSRFSQP